jgi:hypothetical protein
MRYALSLLDRDISTTVVILEAVGTVTSARVCTCSRSPGLQTVLASAVPPSIVWPVSSRHPIAEHVLAFPYPGLFALLLLVAGLVPTGSIPSDGSAEAARIVLDSAGLDLRVHAIGYGAFAGVLVIASNRLSWSILFGAVLLATAFGAVVELLQWPIPWRTSSVLDALANGVGACIGAVLAGVVRAFRQR